MVTHESLFEGELSVMLLPRLASVIVAVAVAASSLAQRRTIDNTAQALACAQAALGLRDISTLKSIQLDGRLVATQLSGELLTMTLEIRSLLPDNFLRVEGERYEEGTVRTSHGFSQTRLLTNVKTDSPKLRFGGSWGPEQLPIERRDAAVFLLELLALPLPGVEIGARVSPSSDGGWLIPAHIEDRDISLHLDARCVPTELTYSGPVHLPTPGQRVSFPPPPTTMEVHVAIADRVRMDGILVPQSLIKQAGGIVLERIEITRFRKNVPLTLRDFAR